jgi:hypothetical protein
VDGWDPQRASTKPTPTREPPIGSLRHDTPHHNGEFERYNRILAEEVLYARDRTSETSDQKP